MKKIIALMLSCVMLLAIASVGVFAAGSEIIHDPMDSEDLTIWWGSDAGEMCYYEDGVCHAYSEAKVHQTRYEHTDDGGVTGKVWATFTTKVTVRLVEDDNDGDHGVGLWFRDYAPEIAGEVEDGPEYWFYYDADKGEFSFKQGYGDGALDLGCSYQLEAPLEWGMNSDTFTLGMRVGVGFVECFYNDQKLFTYTASAENGTGTIGTVNTPILLRNNGMYCTWDEFYVGTVDYNLFNESEAVITTAADGGNDTTAGNGAAGTTAAIVTAAVTDADGKTVTDADGKVVTETVKVADTNKGTTGGSSSQTGDTAAIVIAAMIVSLGTAIVVKKVSAR